MSQPVVWANEPAHTSPTNATNFNAISKRLAYSVKDYGAVVDGTTVDTVAAQAAIDACAAAGGGVVWFPAGTCLANLVQPPSVTLMGAGEGVSIIKLPANTSADVIKSSNFAVLTGTGSLAGIHHCSIQNLTIDGNAANNTGNGGYGIRLFGYLFEFRSVTIRNCVQWGLYTEWGRSIGQALPSPDFAMEARYHSLRIHDCAGGGWRNRGPNDSQALNVFIHNNGNVGLLCESMEPVAVTVASNGVATSSFAGAGVLNVNTTVGYPPTGTLSVASTTGTAVVTYTGKTTATFTGCTTTSGGGGTLATGGAVSSPGAYYGTGLVASNLHVWGAHSIGMQLDNASLIGTNVSSEGATTGQIWCRTSGFQLFGAKIYSGGVAGTYGIRMGDSTGYAVGKCVLSDVFIGDPDFAGNSASTYSLKLENSYGGNRITGILSTASGSQHLVGTPQGNDSIDLTVVGQVINWFMGGLVTAGGSATFSGDTRSGIVTVTVPGGSTIGTAPGTLIGFTLPVAFMRNPQVIVTPINSASAALGPSATGYSTSQGSVDVRVAPVAGTTYYFTYLIIP